MTEKRIERIRDLLNAALDPIELEVTDESHQHVGHEGAKSGKGHFHVRIVSTQFQGLNLVRCHRLIYEALGDFMETDIHALGIDAAPPGDT